MTEELHEPQPFNYVNNNEYYTNWKQTTPNDAVEALNKAITNKKSFVEVILGDEYVHPHFRYIKVTAKIPQDIYDDCIYLIKVFIKKYYNVKADIASTAHVEHLSENLKKNCYKGLDAKVVKFGFIVKNIVVEASPFRKIAAAEFEDTDFETCGLYYGHEGVYNEGPMEHISARPFINMLALENHYHPEKGLGYVVSGSVEDLFVHPLKPFTVSPIII